ncbi:type II toxin-antitoxin system RelE/ParE family toxin [Flavimarina sp. Hel_I_48]|uniref:type II toxin-antitoxin system RelE/ParE family toxin n=1 Tax=Flavimarina sp. Hel_I_48 TaxID=1392488 RepID=UPI0004DF4E16
MSLILIILPRAELEIEKSFHFYNVSRTDLGNNFLKELDYYFDLILQNPRTFRKNNLGFREAVIKRFPFLIIYEQLEDYLYIYSVFNTNRNPSTKPK